MNRNFRQIVLSIGLFLICLSKSFSQTDTVVFFVDTIRPLADQLIEVPIKVKNFESVKGFQFSMAWSPDSLTYDSIGSIELPGLVFSSFNVSQVDNGIFSVVWLDPTVQGVSVPDSSAIFSLFFDPFETCDSLANIYFTQNPTMYQVLGVNGMGQDVVLDYQFLDGVIESRCPDLDVNFAIDGTIQQNITVCAPIELTFTDSSFSEIGITQWSWDSGNGQLSTDTNATFLYEEPGTFTGSLIIDDNYTMDTLGFEVVVNPTIDVDFTFQLDPCGSTFVSFQGVNNGSTNIISWDWDFGNNNSNAGQNTFQTYNEYDVDYNVVLTVVDQNGCTATVEKIVNIPDVILLEADPVEIQLPGCDTASGQIILETIGGVGPFTYAWSHDDMLFDSIASGLDPGDYTVTVIDALGCIGTTTTFLTSIDSFPSVNLGLDTSFCFGGNITLDAGEEGVEYEWFLNDVVINGEVNSLLSANETGTYIANVTNEFNCTASDTLILDVFELPEVMLGADTTICEGDTLTLNVQTNAIQYDWSLNSSPLNENGPSLEVLENGLYAVVVTDQNGCTNADELEVTFADPPIIEVGADTTICDGEEILLQVPDEGYDYEWYLNQNTLVGTANELNTSLAGNYTLVASNEEGCSVSDNIAIAVAALPEIDLGSDTTICWDEETTFMGDPTLSTYQWMLAGNAIHGENAPSFTTGEPNEYVLVVSNEFDCISSDTILLEKFPIPILELGSDTSLCFEDTLQVNNLEILADDNSSIEWQFAGNPIESDELLFEDGLLSAILTDINNCSISDSKAIVFSESIIDPLPQNVLRCEEDALVFNQNSIGGVDYSWSLNNEVISELNIIEVSENGLLILTAQNDLCEQLDSVLILDGFPEEVNLSIDTITSCELLPIDISVLNPDSFDQSSFQWFFNGSELAGENQSEINIDQTGTYTLEVTNVNGCIKEDTSEVIYTIPITFNFPEDGELTCIGRPIELEVLAQNFANITWEKDSEIIENENSNPNIFETSEPGVYSVTVIDEIGCIYEDAVTLIQGEEPQLDFGADTIGVCIGDTIILSHDEVYFSYAWFLNGMDISNNQQIEVTEPGVYVNAVNNSIGCLGRDTVTIELLDTTIISLAGESFICSSMNSDLVAFPSNLSAYEWYFNDQLIIEETGSNIIAEESGWYKVGYLNEFGCYSEDSLQIVVSQIESPNLLEDITLCSDPTTLTSNINEIYLHEWTLDGELIQSSQVDSLIANQAGTYTVTIFNEDDCSSSDTIIVNQGVVPDVSLGDDIEICEGELATFEVNDGFSYTWLLDGEEVDDENTNVLTTDKSGTYMVVAISEDDCESTDEAVVVINPLPEVDLGMDASICPEANYNLDASCVNCSVVWNDGTTDDVRDVSTAGEYIATITNEFDCSVSDTFNLSLFEAAMPDLGEDIDLCIDESVTLDPGVFSTYDWSIGNSSSAIDLLATQTNAGASISYWVDVTTPDGCMGSDTIIVNFAPLIQASIEAPINNLCFGDSLELVASGGNFYEWMDLNGNTESISDPFAEAPMVSPTESTTYQVIVGNDCPTDLDTAFFEVTILELPIGDAGRDTCIAEGTDITLNATGGETYLWEINEIYPLSNLESPTPRVAPIESTTYFVTITGENGCSITDSVLVSVAEDPSLNIIPVNIITPNGDGKNDFLEFGNLEKFPRNTLKVYNRWGNKVYEKVGYQNDWGGTYQGKPLPAGSYYYVLSFQPTQIVVKSSLTILRE